MNNYETIIILNNEISKEQKEAIINKITKYINENGKIDTQEDLGEKRLAYEVKKHNKGYYYLIQFKAKAEKIYELERIYRLEDDILKFLTIKREGVEE